MSIDTNRAIIGINKDIIPNIADIEKLCFTTPWSEKSLEMLLDRSLWYTAVCVSDGKPVGYGSMRLIEGCPAEIGNVAVHPNYRRMGIGRDIVGKLLREAKERGFDFVLLEVRESNTAAIGLYKELGFHQLGEKRVRIYSNPVEDGFEMIACTKGLFLC